MNAAAEMTALRGNLLLDEPMAKHTSWRIGGPADRYYQPADVDDLAEFLAQLPAGEPLFWLGLGSNLLVRDGGIRGTVIATSGVVNGLEQLTENSVRAEAGVACAKVARFCARAGLTGAEERKPRGMKSSHILVAEDDRNILTGLIDTLSSEGYKVTAATDGERALRLLEENEFDLAILDIMMPGKSGYDVCREIRSRDEDMVIMMLT